MSGWETTSNRKTNTGEKKWAKARVMMKKRVLIIYNNINLHVRAKKVSAYIIKENIKERERKKKHLLVPHNSEKHQISKAP